MIRAGGTSTLLHHLLMRTGLLPWEVLALPPGKRAFVLASMRIYLESETSS